MTDVTDHIISEHRTIDSDTWTLDEFLREIEDTVADVPETWRWSIRVSLEEFYGDAKIVITFDRPETDHEREIRSQREAILKASRVDEDRRLYERLKAKFEPGE
jgi:hypothetical protein